MNNINSNCNNINFTAKMNILAGDVNLKRLEGIAEKFEAKTKNYPNDTFELNGTRRTGYQIYHFDKKYNEENCCDMPTNQFLKLMKKSDDYVANKFVKLLDIFKKKDEEISKASKYISSVVKNDKNNDPTNFEQKFWDIMWEKVTKDRNIAVAKDPTLKNFEIY